MRLANCLHGLGAIGVELVAVLALGWVLSLSHSTQGVSVNDCCLTCATVPVNSQEVDCPEQREVDRETFAADQLKRSSDGLFNHLASHLNDVFMVADET